MSGALPRVDLYDASPAPTSPKRRFHFGSMKSFGGTRLVGGTPINPQWPLVWYGSIAALFGIYMLLNPAGFLEQYNISVSSMIDTDRMIIEGMFQQWGIWNIMLVGVCSIAIRAGSQQTRMHLNLAGCASCCFNICLLVVGFHAWSSVGCSQAGLLFNLWLTLITMILFALGAGLSVELAPIEKPIYWASCVMAGLGLAYALMFLLFPQMMMNAYRVTIHSHEAHMLMLTILRFGWSGFFFQMSAWLLVGMMTTDFMYIYVLTRYLAMIQFGMFLFNSANLAWFNTMDENGDLDGLIVGQWMNCFMSVAFVFLTYVPLIKLDAQLTKHVKYIISGQQLNPDLSLTLLPASSPPKKESLRAEGE